jgi:hypothetical protein
MMMDWTLIQTLMQLRIDFIGCNTEKGRRPPPHLTGHKVYEMVKDAHVVLGKRKMTDKNTEDDDMWKKQSILWKLSY